MTLNPCLLSRHACQSAFISLRGTRSFGLRDEKSQNAGQDLTMSYTINWYLNTVTNITTFLVPRHRVQHQQVPIPNKTSKLSPLEAVL